MGTDCKSAAFQLRWFESTRAHKKTASVEIRWRFSVCRRFEFSCGRIRTAAALSQKTAQKQPGGLFLAARLAQSTRAHKKTVSVEIRWRFSVCRRFGFSCGWIRTASTRRIVRRGKKPLRGFFRCAACVIHLRP